MISKKVLNAYMSFKGRNLHKIKKLNKKQLKEKVYGKVPAGFFKFEPYKHQLACLLVGLRFKRVLFFLDLGLGKTKLILDIYKVLRYKKEVKRILVLVPYTTNVYEWEEQAKIHTPAARVTCIADKVDGDRFQAALRGQVVVMTYQGLLFLLKKNVLKRKGKKKVPGWSVDLKKARQLADSFDMVAYDEITAIREKKSTYFSACLKITNAVDYRYGLTGTPFGKDPQALWPQFYLIDKGEALGKHLGLYREGFFIENKSKWKTVYQFVDRVAHLLHRRMKHTAIHYRQDECLDMPKLVQYHRFCVWSDEQWKHYEKIVDEIKSASSILELPESTYLNSRYLAAGYLLMKDTEDSKHKITFKNNNKMEMLLDIIGNMPDEAKIIVFGVYNPTIELISSVLVSKKIKHAIIYGKQSAKQKKLSTEKFKNDKTTKVLVASEAAGYGLNLQVANYVAMYESPSDPIVLKQMIGRVHRGGQKAKRVFIYHLMIKNSVDEKIRQGHFESEDLYKKIVEGNTR